MHGEKRERGGRRSAEEELETIGWYETASEKYKLDSGVRRR